ncbi:reverse transcriptase [Elysia marginata]|uniref:Reverse transcriptase n=1 Tax=Elysia marginata TaxID=1093978 RepID=A0AAV4ENC7_9GAST|nr:reverse transcriptase [Elysia marginata]
MNTGWGVWIENTSSRSETLAQTQGAWSPDLQHFNINVLELKAVLFGLHRLCDRFYDCHIQIHTDNTTALTYINSYGGTKSWLCDSVARQIWDWAIRKKNFTFLRFSYPFNWPRSEENRAGPGAENPDSTMLTHTSVVFKAPVAAIPTTSNPCQVGPSPLSSHLQRATPPREEDKTDCLAIVRRTLNNRKIPKGAQEIIFNLWMDSTKSIYSTYIRQWIQYIHRRGGDPFREDMNLILEFLSDLHKRGMPILYDISKNGPYMEWKIYKVEDIDVLSTIS